MKEIIGFKEQYLKVISSVMGDAGKDLYFNAIAGRISANDIPSSVSIDQVEAIRGMGVFAFEIPKNINFKDSLSVNADKETRQAYALVKSLPDQAQAFRQYESKLLEYARETRKNLRIQTVKSIGVDFATLLNDEIDYSITKMLGKNVSFKSLDEVNDDIYKAVKTLLGSIKIDPDEGQLLAINFEDNSVLIAFGTDFKFPIWKKVIEVKDDKLSYCFLVSGKAPILNYLDESALETKTDTIFKGDEFKLPWAPSKTVKIQKTICNQVGVTFKSQRYIVTNTISIAS